MAEIGKLNYSINFATGSAKDYKKKVHAALHEGYPASKIGLKGC